MERVGGMLPLEVSDVVTSSFYNHGQVCYTVLLSTECVCTLLWYRFWIVKVLLEGE